MTKSSYIFWGVLLAALLAGAIGVYVTNFPALSDDPAEWGQLGDYLGGVLTPLFSLLTLIFTIIIAHRLSHLDEKRHLAALQYEEERQEKAAALEMARKERELDLEEERHKRTLAYDRKRLLNELREAEYKKIAPVLCAHHQNKLMHSYANNEEKVSILKGLLMEVAVFRTVNQHLFPFLREEYKAEEGYKAYEEVDVALKWLISVINFHYIIREAPVTEDVKEGIQKAEDRLSESIYKSTNYFQGFLLEQMDLVEVEE